MFSRHRPNAATGTVVAPAKDEGLLNRQASCFPYLKSISPGMLDHWANLTAGDHVLHVPQLSELGGVLPLDHLLACRLPNGGVHIRPPSEEGIPSMPDLRVEYTGNGWDVQCKLNDKVLDMHSDPQDILLAAQLVTLLVKHR